LALLIDIILLLVTIITIVTAIGLGNAKHIPIKLITSNTLLILVWSLTAAYTRRRTSRPRVWDSISTREIRDGRTGRCIVAGNQGNRR
jgi:hypothetical protein